jgi:alanyl-tRNA synthetase
MLDDLLDSLRKSGDKTIPGEEVFKLYDTYGFPLDLVKDIALDSGLAIDEGGFHNAMEAQRERARASWVGEDEALSTVYRELLSEVGPSEFLGYETLESDSTVKAIVQDGKAVVEVREGEECEVFLDRTPFYAESGGQVGDAGALFSEEVRLEVVDTKKPVEGLHSHVVRIRKGPLRVWMKVRARVDAERRRDIMRNHTATHLMQAALRSVLGEHVKQAGSLVEPGRLRFDFTHFSAVEKEELSSIEELVNDKVMEDLEVNATVTDMDEAIKSGAMALFGEKYGEEVRVLEIADFSRELCGGTHCGRTGEIGPFVISSEGSVASGIRRIEALTGRNALAAMKAERKEFEKVGAELKIPLPSIGAYLTDAVSEPPSEKARQLSDEIKGLQREKEKAKVAGMKDMSLEIAQSAKTLDGFKVVSCRVSGLGQKDLRGLADNVRDRLGSGVLVLASENEGQALFLAMVTKDLTRRLSAGKILKEVASRSGGRGGGKPDMAQGGTKDLDKLDSALESVYDIVKGQAGS